MKKTQEITEFPKAFAVHVKRFSLAQAFVEEAESIGWTYLHDFTPFDEHSFHVEFEGSAASCLFFSYEFEGYEGQPCFALSKNYDPKRMIQLETDFELSLKKATESYVLTLDIDYTEEEEEPTTFVFENGMELEIDFKSGTATVLVLPEMEDGQIRFSLNEIVDLSDYIENSRP